MRNYSILTFVIEILVLKLKNLFQGSSLQFRRLFRGKGSFNNCGRDLWNHIFNMNVFNVKHADHNSIKARNTMIYVLLMVENKRVGKLVWIAEKKDAM